MAVSIRPYAPEDVESLVALMNQVRLTPMTAADYQEQIARREPHLYLHRILAELDGRAVGIAVLVQAPWNQRFICNVVVDRAHRGRGIGAALWAALGPEVSSRRVEPGVEAAVRDNAPESRAWAERRGFRFYRHQFESRLALDEAYRGRGVATALKARSIEWAKGQGGNAPWTHNDSRNAPMLAVNRRLGYEPQPGNWWLVWEGP